MPNTNPNPRFTSEILQRAQAVRMVFFDIDGVFTDGGIYYSDEGESLKRFHTLDGYGLRMLEQIGVKLVVISGRDSTALRKRLASLNISHMALGTIQKLAAATSFLDTFQLGWEHAAAIGDDWPDLPVMQRATLAVAPPHAHTEVLQTAHHTTSAAGGHGAVRELCDIILHAQGHYTRLLQAQLAP